MWAIPRVPLAGVAKMSRNRQAVAIKGMNWFNETFPGPDAWGRSDMSLSDLLPDGSMARPYQPSLSQVLETLGGDVLSSAYVPDDRHLTVG